MTNIDRIAKAIQAGQCVLGIELGSTRIKAVLIDENHAPIAMGAHDWENQYVDNIWTYDMADMWAGVRDAYAKMKADVLKRYDVVLTTLGGMGISAMMHGYLPFDKDDNQLAAFRSWRNTMTEEAAEKLTDLFDFNIPQRWSIAHLYQAMLNQEAHVKDIAHLNTLAGYIHWQLTGQKVLGIGEASGMVPIDSTINTYDEKMMNAFDQIASDMGYSWTLSDLLPSVLNAGESAGTLTDAGAMRLDPTGNLQAGVPFCPPEGDASTGMVATNSVAIGTGNISAGTSVFAMIVLEKALSKLYPEIDMLTTPSGLPVAMVHCNTCTSDINAWAEVLFGFAKATGTPCEMNDVYVTLFNAAMQADKDCGGVINCNYFSGEPITGMKEGRPLLMRMADAYFNFGNFARALVNGAIVTLKLGMDILVEQEKVSVHSLLGHGGFFKTKGVGQSLLAAALKTPVSVMETAGEGGPWGMALLASYMVHRAEGETLVDYLNHHVFADAKSETVEPNDQDVQGFEVYCKHFEKSLAVERVAIDALV